MAGNGNGAARMLVGILGGLLAGLLLTGIPLINVIANSVSSEDLAERDNRITALEVDMSRNASRIDNLERELAALVSAQQQQP